MYKCMNMDCPATQKHIKPMGRCPECGEFGTMEEIPEIEIPKKKNKVSESDIIPKTKDQLEGITLGGNNNSIKYPRLMTSDKSINTFFGGGVVLGSINLISGVPGVGKSTFLLNIAKYLQKEKIVYISGEESLSQIESRAVRLSTKDYKFENVILYNEKLLENIITIVEKEKPKLLIIDSLQVLESSNQDGEIGGLKQQKYIIRKLLDKLKELNIPTFLVGHVNKDDEIAGAMFIEHMVDSVIKIEPMSERGDSLKIMKNLKNRFSGSEILCFELLDDGIETISSEKLAELFIQEATLDKKGTALSAIQRGNQIFLTEIQSIVTQKEYNYSEKIINNYNKDKFKILLKIIGQNAYENIYDTDVATNIVSPLRNNPSDIDLAIIMSILSYINGFVLGKTVFLGQVGFNAEIKSVSRQSDMIKRLKNIGFKDEDIITNNDYNNLIDIVKKFQIKNKK